MNTYASNADKKADKKASKLAIGTFVKHRAIALCAVTALAIAASCLLAFVYQLLRGTEVDYLLVALIPALGMPILSALVSRIEPTSSAREDDLLTRNAQLERANRRYQQMIDLAPVPICIVEGDRSSRSFTYVNEEALRLIGYSRDEMLGHNASKMTFLNDEDAQFYMQHVVESMKTGVPLRLEMPLYRKGRVVGQFEFNCRYIMEGEELFGILFVMDIEERKRQEQAVIDAKNRAEHALLAESRFLSNMSHEIRNPLNGVLGMVSHALDETREPAIKDMLETASAAGGHLLSIVDDILDFKKIEEGEFTLASESFDFHEASRLMRQIYLRNAKDHGVDFEFASNLADLPRFVIADRKRLTQVLMNLISNAIKFTPEGGKVTLSSSYGHHQQTLRFSVQDTGLGMSADTLAHLFERFKQGNDGTTKQFKGTGLGLAITKELVNLMGGSISVESAPGEGSTFVVEVPLKIDEDRERLQDERAEATAAITAMEHIDLRGIRVLCVDDCNINLMVLDKPLRRAGADVTLANSARQALSLLSSDRFDLVLTDISMPDMDGEEMYRRLIASGSDVPVVAITANVLRADIERYMSSGFAATLPKPIHAKRLIGIVSEFGKPRDTTMSYAP